MATAKALLSRKDNSFECEDRVVRLSSSPLRIGRSHKEEKADSDNGYFDCKVLSRNHANLSFEDGKFFIQDTGSSNGTFINNIRLSKCGEQSKLTEIYSEDTLRFGSDVVDKAKNVTQKCVVVALRLWYPDGLEYDFRPTSSRLYRKSSDGAADDVIKEKNELLGRVVALEEKLAESEKFCTSAAIKHDRDATEISKLRLLIDTQNNDIADLENALNNTQNELEQLHTASRAGNAEIIESELSKLRHKYEDEISSLLAEEETLKMNLDESSQTISLLREEVKDLKQEAHKNTSEFECKQKLEYEIECLRTELQHSQMQLQLNQENKIIERSEEDVKLIDEQMENIEKLKAEVAYIKKELIDARARKSAAEDELNTVKGTVETFHNSSKALSNEIEQLNETVKLLNKNLDEETAKSTHLENLVAAMESQPDVEARSKVEISDLKNELATAQADLKVKIEEVQQTKDKVRLEKETVQQKEIDISRLNGRVQFLEEEMEALKSRTGDCDKLDGEINSLRSKLNYEQTEHEVTRSDNIKLSSELQQLQVLYSELKKMRGRGNELELLEAAQRDVVEARALAEEYYTSWQQSTADLERLKKDNQALSTMKQNQTEVTQSNGETVESIKVTESSSKVSEVQHDEKSPLMKRAIFASETVMGNIGSLKFYEIMLGLLFISIIISWNPYY